MSRALVLLVVLLTVGCSSSTPVAGGAGSAATETDAATLYIRTCGGCHGAKGTPQAQESLPSLDGLTAAQLEAKILHGGVQMPTFAAALSDDELSTIVDYLLDD